MIFSDHNNSLLITNGPDNCVETFDPSTYEHMQTLKGYHNDYVLCIEALDEEHFASGS